MAPSLIAPAGLLITFLLSFITFASASKAVASLYHGPGCAFPATSFIGTCEGNCFQYDSFDSIWTVGGTGTLRCHAYSDDNCQTEIKDTGDDSGKGTCSEASGAKSVICYSGC